MNMYESTIEWNQAQHENAEACKRAKVNRQAMLEEFLESKCDMFTSQDLYYYQEQTGKSIQWLLDNASFNDEAGAHGQMLDNAMYFNDYDLVELIVH